MKTLLCAIYTRKSSEEGLEQDFNSLDAQRESSEAYVRSQKHEGWKVVSTAYDDGGYSGGTLERPALKRLLSDVTTGKIHVVVVYKVDRLTRSLADFAKIVETFDQHGVSFVSVTQQFNTTTSMGRLTLNVLLSFAQFEREVTGERIRDKIAASKQKGMWMGGSPPLGYVADKRTLLIDEASGQLVREIYRLYLEYGCARAVKEELDRRGCVTRMRTSEESGTTGGAPFSRGHLYRILGNPIYAGKISHKGKIYPGQHEAIIPEADWEAVQQQLAANWHDKSVRVRAKDPSLLAGLVFDDQGRRLIPHHASNQGKRYRYYVLQSLLEQSKDEVQDALRIPAHELESAVINGLIRFLSDDGALLGELTPGDAEQSRNLLRRARQKAQALQPEAHTQAQGAKVAILREIVHRVLVAKKEVRVEMKMGSLLGSNQPQSSDPMLITLTLPIALTRCGMAMRLIVNAPGHEARQPDATLIALLAKAQDWFSRLRSGKADCIKSIAQAENVTSSYVTRVIYLAFLAPDIVKTIMAGKQPPTLSAQRLIQLVPLPLHWPEQRALLGFDHPSTTP